jgi:hypothetical protein
VDLLGAFGEEAAFHRAEEGAAPLTVDVIGKLARRVDRLEEILEAFREGTSPDRAGFDALRRRLMDVGIETDMGAGEETEEASPGPRSRGAGPDRDEEDDH